MDDRHLRPSAVDLGASLRVGHRSGPVIGCQPGACLVDDRQHKDGPGRSPLAMAGAEIQRICRLSFTGANSIFDRNDRRVLRPKTRAFLLGHWDCRRRSGLQRSLHPGYSVTSGIRDNLPIKPCANPKFAQIQFSRRHLAEDLPVRAHPGRASKEPERRGRLGNFPALPRQPRFGARQNAILVAIYPLVWGGLQIATGWASDILGRKP